MFYPSSKPVGRMAAALICLLLSATLHAQTLWRKSAERPSANVPSNGHYAVYELNLAPFQTTLRNAPSENSRNASGVKLSLPGPTGAMMEFLFAETKLFSPGDGAAPDVRTYTGRTSDGRMVAHLTVGGNDVQGIVVGPETTWFIATPRGASGKNLVEVYDVQGRPFKSGPAKCGADGEPMKLPAGNNRVGEVMRTPSVSCAVKTYRLAIAGTADYTAYFGSQAAAFANTVAMVNNVNALYERDLGARFTLVTDQSLMYTDAATDPFVNSGANACTEITPAQNTFTSVVGSGNYDLGVVLYGQNFGGCAYVGATCSNNFKGGATAGYDFPTPSSYLLEVTAHEIGHLFGAGHSHNATGDNCVITPSSAWEPGGGSTIMAYSGCSPSFESYNSTLYFHGGNLGQMRTYIATGGGCYTTGAANTSPLLTAPTDGTFYIPISTPFRLYAEATDAEDQNTLTYTFEQMDLGTGSAVPPSPTTPSGPVFRSFEPSAKNFRYMPRMDSILAGVTPIFESLPSVNRNLTFWTTVRDNKPGCGCQSVDTIAVATSGSTPFRVSSQPTTTTATAGSSLTVTWDVAGTTGAPFNTANVRILFAGDGLNYNTVLAASTPNDGSQQVTLPNITTTNGRVMVAAIGNLFFDINDANITVQTPCGDVQRNQLYPETFVSALTGSSDLQLTQTAAFGQGSDGFDGEITNTDPTAGTTGLRTSFTDATCTEMGFGGRYDVIPFYTVVPGTYQFSRTLSSLSGTIFFSLYSAGGYSSGNVCSNFLFSNAWRNGGSASYYNDFSYSLAANSTYNLAFKVLNTSAFGTYRVNVRGPGPIFTEGKNAGNAYSYVVVNAAGIITSVSTTAPDLRSAAAGTYFVYGVSHSSAVNLTSYQGQSFDNLLYGSFSAGGCVSVSNNRREVAVRSSVTLPLTYVKLTATAEGSTAKLRWTVSDDNDAAGAVVEHSTDGVSFTPVVSLSTGQGRLSAAEYGYQHATPAGGKNFYRIKQLARTGGWLYSNTAVVEFDAKPYVTVTPNPTTGRVTITSLGQQRFVPFTLRVYDNKGQELGRYLVNRQAYSVDLSALPAGVYVLMGDAGVMQKLIKQ